MVIGRQLRLGSIVIQMKIDVIMDILKQRYDEMLQ